MARTVGRSRRVGCNCRSSSPPPDSPQDPVPDSSSNSPPLQPSFAAASLSREFLRFQHLPLELRREIWQHALPPPCTIRVIREDERDYSDSDSDTKTTSKICVFRSDDCMKGRLPTPLLHVCRESRAVALRSYKLAYKPTKRRLYVYVDVARDSLFLGDSCRGTKLSSQVRDGIRWLEISGKRYDTLWPQIRDEFLAEVMTGFPAARELRIWENHSSACGRFKISLRETAAIEREFDRDRADWGWSPLKIILMPDESKVVDTTLIPILSASPFPTLFRQHQVHRVAGRQPLYQASGCPPGTPVRRSDRLAKISKR